jgi:hypothetical protein
MYFLRIPDIKTVRDDIFNLLCEIRVGSISLTLSTAVFRIVNTIDIFTAVETSILAKKLRFINTAFQYRLCNLKYTKGVTLQER